MTLTFDFSFITYVLKCIISPYCFLQVASGGFNPSMTGGKYLKLSIGLECLMRERERERAQLVRLPNRETRWSWVQPLHSTVASSELRKRYMKYIIER